MRSPRHTPPISLSTHAASQASLELKAGSGFDAVLGQLVAPGAASRDGHSDGGLVGVLQEVSDGADDHEGDDGAKGKLAT